MVLWDPQDVYKRQGQQGVQQLPLERILFFLLEGAALLVLDGLHLLCQRFLDDGGRQDLVLAAGAQQDLAVGGMGQGVACLLYTSRCV